jgi:hypothetical protein
MTGKTRAVLKGMTTSSNLRPSCHISSDVQLYILSPTVRTLTQLLSRRAGAGCWLAVAGSYSMSVRLTGGQTADQFILLSKC